MWVMSVHVYYVAGKACSNIAYICNCVPLDLSLWMMVPLDLILGHTSILWGLNLGVSTILWFQFINQILHCISLYMLAAFLSCVSGICMRGKKSPSPGLEPMLNPGPVTTLPHPLHQSDLPSPYPKGKRVIPDSFFIS